MRATVRATGACGELVQGLIGGVLCHITCPVALYATVTVELGDAPGTVRAPAERPKTAQAVKTTLRFLNARYTAAAVIVTSELPVGKGMASSTADVAAAIAATGLALGVTLTPEQIARLAVQVEPSDGIMFPGIALFDHRDGSVREPLGPPPPLEVLVLDFGGAVDTLEFNRVDRTALLRELAPTTERAADLVRRGLADGDAALIGQGATVSALAHQRVLFKPQLPAVLDFAHQIGAVGVNVAHSGAVIGVLLDGSQTAPSGGEAALHAARRTFPHAEAIRLTSVIGGGLHVVTSDLTAAPAKRR
ncbi:MAG: GHMP kinase [Dehalococcoidia bacterium]|nr:GHMP kinase [Dehalococcoidia bacterium]